MQHCMHGVCMINTLELVMCWREQRAAAPRHSIHWPSQHLSESTIVQPMHGVIGPKVHSLSLLGRVQGRPVGHCMIAFVCAQIGQLQKLKCIPECCMRSFLHVHMSLSLTAYS